MKGEGWHPPLTLLFLAAGLGSRFGGLKQLEPLGPHGATLMDYSIFDALQAGFTRVVFVIRDEIVDEFERTVGARYRGTLDVETVCQRLDALPPGVSSPAGRTRPWGTAQAVLAARDRLHGPFAVLNADDCYGRAAIEELGAFLQRSAAGAAEHAVVGYRLDLTESPSGGVNRALLRCDADGMLLEVLELADLSRTASGEYAGLRDGRPERVPAGSLVSMNLWGFTQAILPVLDGALRRFLEARPAPTAELRVADAVQEGIDRHEAVVRVLPTTSRWCGVTHPSDRDWVRATLSELVRGGVYPERMWELGSEK